MNFFEGRSKTFYLVIGIILVLLIALIDLGIGSQVTFSYFYFIPISLVTWYVSENYGFVMSIFSGISWTIIEIIQTPQNFSGGIFYINSALRFSFLIIIVLSLNILKKNFDSEKGFARRDPLTGVANRRAFYEVARQEIERSKRNKLTLSLAYIDIDNFKAVNDILGHEIGDQVLTYVGNIIRKNIRKSDTVARLGGDEFIILMPQTKGDESKIVMERILQDLFAVMKKNVWFVTFTIGLVTYKTPPKNIQEGIKEADRVMYKAKQAGKNMIKAEIIE